ncbi:MAG: HesA/MoeB/ThiF family protein [Maritimibacter sp.]
MILVLAVYALIFAGVRFGKIPRLAGWCLGWSFLAWIVLTHLLFGDEHPVSQMLGGSLAEWLTLLIFAALVTAYLPLLKMLKARAKPAETPLQTGTFSDSELDRYARHIIMREIGGPGQKALKDAKVLVIGAGGLGAPALLYLAAAGIGTIGVIDDDEVDNSNLQRQVIHTDERIGMPKVFSAQTAMLAQNPHVVVRPYERRLTPENAQDLFADYDLILEGSDNFETRYLANRVAAQLGKPLIGGALTQWEGQISLYDPARGHACYQCVFPEAPAAGLAPSCAEAGVVGPLPGVIGSMMAVEAIKVITGAGESLAGRLMIYDALYGETRFIKVKKREDCPVCGTGNTASARLA